MNTENFGEMRHHPGCLPWLELEGSKSDPLWRPVGERAHRSSALRAGPKRPILALFWAVLCLCPVHPRNVTPGMGRQRAVRFASPPKGNCLSKEQFDTPRPTTGGDLCPPTGGGGIVGHGVLTKQVSSNEGVGRWTCWWLVKQSPWTGQTSETVSSNGGGGGGRWTWGGFPFLFTGGISQENVSEPFTISIHDTWRPNSAAESNFHFLSGLEDPDCLLCLAKAPGPGRVPSGCTRLGVAPDRRRGLFQPAKSELVQASVAGVHGRR